MERQTLLFVLLFLQFLSSSTQTSVGDSGLCGLALTDEEKGLAVSRTSGQTIFIALPDSGSSSFFPQYTFGSLIDAFGFNATFVSSSSLPPPAEWNLFPSPIVDLESLGDDSTTLSPLISSSLLLNLGVIGYSTQDNIFLPTSFVKQEWDSSGFVADHYHSLSNNAFLGKLTTLKLLPLTARDVSRDFCGQEGGCDDGIYSEKCRVIDINDCPMLVALPPTSSSFPLHQLIRNLNWGIGVVYVDSVETTWEYMQYSSKPLLFTLPSPHPLASENEFSRIRLPLYDPDQWGGDAAKSYTGPISTDFPLIHLSKISSPSLAEMAPQVLSILTKMTLLLSTIEDENMLLAEGSESVQEEACYFLRNHTDLWRQWLPINDTQIKVYFATFQTFDELQTKLVYQATSKHSPRLDIVHTEYMSDLEATCQRLHLEKNAVGFVILPPTDSEGSCSSLLHIPIYKAGMGVVVHLKSYSRSQFDAFIIGVVSQDTVEALSYLVIGLIIACHLVWFFERNVNADEFPPEYLDGIDDAAWWAIATATTIGYGDKTPKSRMGRFIAAIWMLLGLLLATYFTGVVTSQMTVMLTEKVVRGLSDVQSITSVKILPTSSPSTTAEGAALWSTVSTIIPHLERAGVDSHDVCEWDDCVASLGKGDIDALIGDYPTMVKRIQETQDGNLRLVGPQNDRADQPDGILFSLMILIDRDSPFALSLQSVAEMLLSSEDNLVDELFGDTMRSSGDVPDGASINVTRIVLGVLLGSILLAYCAGLTITSLPHWFMKKRRTLTWRTIFSAMVQKADSKPDSEKELLDMLKSAREEASAVKAEMTRGFPLPAPSSQSSPKYDPDMSEGGTSYYSSASNAVHAVNNAFGGDDEGAGVRGRMALNTAEGFVKYATVVRPDDVELSGGKATICVNVGAGAVITAPAEKEGKEGEGNKTIGSLPISLSNGRRLHPLPPPKISGSIAPAASSTFFPPPSVLRPSPAPSPPDFYVGGVDPVEVDADQGVEMVAPVNVRSSQRTFETGSASGLQNRVVPRFYSNTSSYDYSSTPTVAASVGSNTHTAPGTDMLMTDSESDRRPRRGLKEESSTAAAPAAAASVSSVPGTNQSKERQSPVAGLRNNNSIAHNFHSNDTHRNNTNNHTNGNDSAPQGPIRLAWNRPTSVENGGETVLT